MSWPIIAAAAVLGLLKSQLVDKPREAADRKLAAATTRYSPWTNLTAGSVQKADPIGTALSYGITGGGLANEMNKSPGTSSAPSSAGIYGPTTTPLVQPTLGGGRAAAAGVGPNLMSSSQMVLPQVSPQLASFKSVQDAWPPRYEGSNRSYEEEKQDNAWASLLRGRR